ncbi:MAG: T9SS type A sorting domain-containing protein, partial [candidate division WOR-3 bacterium]
DSLAQDFFFMKYDIINNNAYSINNLYFGIILDADIGNANDDMVGLLRDRNFTIGTQIIRVKNTGYVYDYDNNEPPGQYWQSGTPGAVAIRLLQAPPGLAMTAFKKFTLDFDPIYDRDQYLTLAGYNYQTGAYEPFDSIDLIPGDKRFLLASGPFNLNAFSTVSFHYAVIGAQYGEAGALPNNRDTTQLAWQSYLADSIYQARIINVGIAEKLSAYDNQSITIYPNPVRTYLNIKSKQGGQLTVEIYNVNGALVNLLTGNDRLQWDGTDNRQQKLPNGIYFVKVISENQTGLSKVLLLR